MQNYGNFSHKTVFYNGRQLYADQYNEKIHKHNIFCQDSHQMIFVNGDIKKKHFRHLTGEQENQCNPDRNNTWHRTVQDLFNKSKQEVIIGENRTDVILNDAAVLEIQHSPICKGAVQQRNKNYRMFGKLTIWWVDCSQHKFENIQTNSRYHIQNSILNALCDQQVPVYIDLISEIWQVAIIKRQDDKKLFVQFVQKYDRQQLVNLLNNHSGIYEDVIIKMDKCVRCQRDTIFNHNFDICQLCYANQRNSALHHQQHLHKVRQSGAGTAKTYTIVKQSLDNLGIYENILFLVKTNGTKQIIIDKINEIIADYPENYAQWQKRQSYQYLNVYYIQFNTKNKQTSIVIATVDSFFCSLSCQNKLQMKKTEYSPLDFSYVADQIGSNSSFTDSLFYKKIQIQNQQFNTLFILDEAQDLKLEYCDAMFNLFKHYNMDFLIVGDKLQTIYIETYSSISPMQKYQDMLQQHYPGEIAEVSQNICNRFQYGRNGYSSQNMIAFVNSFIHFDQFGLQSLQNSTQNIKQDDVQIFQHHSITYSSDSEIEENIKIIMNIFEHHCKIDNMLMPDDFHIIAPQLKKIQLLPQLESEISLFWIQQLQNVISQYDDATAKNEGNVMLGQQQKNKIELYRQLLIENPVFCKLHVSETDGLINLGNSVNMTRIYSFHTSKGEGRQISIVLGLDQGALECHSTVFGDLKYESLLHVAVTRQKRYLYIGYSQSYGDVYDRLHQFMQYNPQSIMQTGIISIANDRFFKIKETHIYQQLTGGSLEQFDRLTNTYKDSLRYLFTDETQQRMSCSQYTLQQLEEILLGDISAMISNYDMSQPDIDMDDYELRDHLFKYNIKQNLCATTIQGIELIKDLRYYMGNIFDNESFKSTNSMSEYRGEIYKKNKMKAKHATYKEQCKQWMQCDCRNKILLNNEQNTTIQQINFDIKKLFTIMYRAKTRGFLLLKCPAQLIVAIFLIYQNKYCITPSKLYYMMVRVRRGLFKIDSCQCSYCLMLPNNNGAEFDQFYKQMFDPQIISDLINILNEIRPAKLAHVSELKELPQCISKEIKIKSEILLYDKQTQTVIYTKQRLTEFNFRETLFKSLIDCYVINENNQINAIVVSTNNHNEKGSDSQKYATNFKIDISDKKHAIEYLVTICYIKHFDGIFNQLLNIIEKQKCINNIKGRLSDKQSAVYDYISEQLNTNPGNKIRKYRKKAPKQLINIAIYYCFLKQKEHAKLLKHINYHKQYCLLSKYLKKDKNEFARFLNKY